MTETIFKPGQEYRTRDGRRARVYASDGQGRFPIHGAYITHKGGWWAAEWTLGGKLNGEGDPDDLDLMPPEPESQRFLLWTTPKIGPETTTVLEIEIQPDCTLKVVR
jgi:hypothetical protein